MINDTYDALMKELQKDRYIVKPINDYRKMKSTPDKVTIGLRHDIDMLFKVAFEMALFERMYRIKSTYYIRHTANYYCTNGTLIGKDFINQLRYMQNECKHEIGLHNDLLSMYVNYMPEDELAAYLTSELRILRANGINIYGSASHGSGTARKYKFLKYFLFKECEWRPKDKNRNDYQSIIHIWCSSRANTCSNW